MRSLQKNDWVVTWAINTHCQSFRTITYYIHTGFRRIQQHINIREYQNPSQCKLHHSSMGLAGKRHLDTVIMINIMTFDQCLIWFICLFYKPRLTRGILIRKKEILTDFAVNATVSRVASTLVCVVQVSTGASIKARLAGALIHICLGHHQQNWEYWWSKCVALIMCYLLALYM